MDEKLASRKAWRAALWHATPISLFVLAIYYYWFGIADRYAVFLYYHEMGPLFDTSPLGDTTRSRYWMTGLVCGGIVLIVYAGINWLLGRLRRDYAPPSWWRTWALVAVPLVVGIPLITMLANDPRLPVLVALNTTLAAILGVGLALAPARMAARQPGALKGLAWDGLAIGGIIQGVSLLERALTMLERGRTYGVFLLGMGLAGAIILLLVVTWLRWWRRLSVPGAPALLAAGFCVAYLLWPLLHYVGFTDGYYYITDMDNFFSRQWAYQFLGWAVAAAVAVALTMWRSRLAKRPERIATSASTAGRATLG